MLEVRHDQQDRPQEQYVWSLRYIDSPVLRDYDADGNAGTGDLGAAGSGLEQRVYYLTDGNFNVTALADPNGAVLERYAYDAYGQPRVYDPNGSPRAYGSSYGNAILFCGYFRDAETGMYHVRNRYYHPALGRWISRDPLGYINGFNLYQYCCSAPQMLLDPLGLGWWSDFKAVAWSTINGAVSGAVSGGIVGLITGGPAGLGAGLVAGAVAGGTFGLVNGIAACNSGGPVNTAALGQASCLGGLISGGFGALGNALSGPLGAYAGNAIAGAGSGGISSAASGGNQDEIAASTIMGGLLGGLGGQGLARGGLEGSAINGLCAAIGELTGTWFKYCRN